MTIKVRSAYMDGDIEHPAAYEAAIRARIKANAAKTRRKNWFAAYPDAQRLWDWLHGYGEFESRFSCGLVGSDYENHRCAEMDRCCGKGVAEHPTRIGMFAGNFGGTLLEMREAIMEWGGLTDKQTDLVRRALARAEERVVNANKRREERVAADRATSQHVGTVGERREFALTVGKVFSFEGIYGTTYINICKDADGNVIVYKGSNGYEEGETLTVKATVKAHDEREGVAQTLIARPKVM
jgi:hypothetical protein